MKSAAIALLLLGGLWLALGALYRWNVAFVDRWAGPQDNKRSGGNAYELAVRFMGPVFFYGGLAMVVLGLALLALHVLLK